MASKYEVPDLATMELMRRFYSGILRQGLPPAAALRAAQAAMRKEQRWRAEKDNGTALALERANAATPGRPWDK